MVFKHLKASKKHLLEGLGLHMFTLSFWKGLLKEELDTFWVSGRSKNHEDKGFHPPKTGFRLPTHTKTLFLSFFWCHQKLMHNAILDPCSSQAFFPDNRKPLGFTALRKVKVFGEGFLSVPGAATIRFTGQNGSLWQKLGLGVCVDWATVEHGMNQSDVHRFA